MDSLPAYLPLANPSPSYRGKPPRTAAEFLERLTAHGACDVREEQLRDWAGLGHLKITRSPKVQVPLGEAVATWLESQRIPGEDFRGWWWRGGDETVRVFQGGLAERLHGTRGVCGIHPLPGDRVIVVWETGLVEQWDTTTMRPIRQVLVAEGELSGSQLSVHGLLAVHGLSDLVHVIEGATLRSLGQFSLMDSVNGGPTVDDDEEDDADAEDPSEEDEEETGEVADEDTEDDDEDGDQGLQIHGMYPLADGCMVFQHADGSRYCIHLESGRCLMGLLLPEEVTEVAVVWSGGANGLPPVGNVPTGWLEIMDDDWIVHIDPALEEDDEDAGLSHPEHGVLHCAPLDADTLLVLTDRSTLRTCSLSKKAWGAEWPLRVVGCELLPARGSRPACALVATSDAAWLVVEPTSGTVRFTFPGRSRFSRVVAVGDALACVYEERYERFVTVDLYRGTVVREWTPQGCLALSQAALPEDRLMLRREDDRVAWYDVRTGRLLGEVASDPS